MTSPTGTPITIAMPRPSSARHSVSHSGPSIVPAATSVTQRTRISDTGGNTYGFTTSIRVASSHATSTAPTGTTRTRKRRARDARPSVCERMPGHRLAQAGNVQSVERVAEHGEIKDDRQHCILGAHTAVGEDQESQARF